MLGFSFWSFIPTCLVTTEWEVSWSSDSSGVFHFPPFDHFDVFLDETRAPFVTDRIVGIMFVVSKERNNDARSFGLLNTSANVWDMYELWLVRCCIGEKVQFPLLIKMLDQYKRKLLKEDAWLLNPSSIWCYMYWQMCFSWALNGFMYLFHSFTGWTYKQSFTGTGYCIKINTTQFP